MHQVSHQETCQRLWRQTQQQQRGRWQPWQFYQDHPQEGHQGSRRRLLGLQHPTCLADTTILQWMRAIPPRQVLQGLEGLIRWQEEEEGCKAHQEELQPQGAQGWRPPLGRCPPPVPLFCQHPCILSIKYFVVKLVCLLWFSDLKLKKRF